MNVPDAACARGHRVQFKFVAGSRGGSLVKQHQPDPHDVAAEDGKVDAGVGDGRARGMGRPGVGWMGGINCKCPLVTCGLGVEANK